MKYQEEKIYNAVGNIIMIILSLFALMPILLLIISSFTSNDALVRDGYSFLPKEFSLEAYVYMFTSTNKIMNAYGISFLVTFLGVLVSLVITSALAYPISRKDMPFHKFFNFMIFFTMLFNGGLVPTYLMYTGVFHLKNTIFGLLIPSLLMNGFNVLLVKSYIVTGIPGEIIQAAQIDGANEFSIFFQIIIPMAKPIIATIGMYVGIAYWNDWYNGYIYLTTKTELYSIQNLLNRMILNIQFLSQSSNFSQAGEGLARIPAVSVRMSMAVMGILPIIVIYPFVQNNFVKGITLGGVKG